MKGGIKKEFIIMAIIIILLGLYLLFQNKDKVHYKIPELNPVDKEDINKVEIKSADKTITLIKKDGNWVIEPKEYATNTEKVNQILDTISNLTLTDLASKVKDYTRFDLSKDKAIKVKAFKDTEELRDFEIGKMASTYGHTFVKIKDNPNVYYARESFRSHFEAKVDDLRDKTVMKLDSNEISEITIEQEGQSYVFAKNVKSTTPPIEIKAEDDKSGDDKQPAAVETPQKPEEQITWTTADGKIGKKSQIDSLINQLTNLSCQEYADDKNIDEIKSQEPIFTLKLKGNKDYMISFYPKIEKKETEGNPGGAMYPAISSENQYPFLLSSWKAEQIMKKPEELIEAEKTEKK